MGRPRKSTNKKITGKKPEAKPGVKTSEHPGVVKSPLVSLPGIKDILPGEQPYWQMAQDKVSQLARDYSFQKIDTPIIEPADLFVKIIGKSIESTDKKIISFAAGRDNKDICLRSDAVPSLARAYAQHNWAEALKPIKLFYFGPFFGYGGNKADECRQFFGAGFEVFDDGSPVTDAQLILIAFNFYKELNIPINVQINSFGCNQCRLEYQKKLVEHYRNKKNLLCPSCKDDFGKNPLLILRCEGEKCVELREDAPQIVDWLCEECKEHFIKVLEYLDELSVPYVLNSCLIAEAAYCARTVFEIWPEDAEGRRKALGEGGRHNNLLTNILTEPAPAAGFVIGLERTIARLRDNKFPLAKRDRPDIFLAQLGETARCKALVLFEDLRNDGIKTAACFAQGALKPQLELAGSLGARLTLILGQKEVLDGTILIRDMEGGIQEVVDYGKVIVEVKKRLI